MNSITARSTIPFQRSKFASKTRHGALICGWISILLTATACCPAATMIYGDYSGADVIFTNVLEESATDPLPLFGAPLSTSNSLSFSPTSFGSSSSGQNADITDSQLSLTMQAVDDSVISAIIIKEAGDYSLTGTGDATANVGAAVFWTVLEINGVTLAGPLPTGTANVTFAQGSGAHGGSFRLPDDVGAANVWTGSLEVDMEDFLASQQLTGMVTKIALTLDNTLSTSSTAGTSAFIKKKESQQVGITAVTKPVPEPDSLWLAWFALVSFRLRWRRLRD
jgi:hypothetical protein